MYDIVWFHCGTSQTRKLDEERPNIQAPSVRDGLRIDGSNIRPAEARRRSKKAPHFKCVESCDYVEVDSRVGPANKSKDEYLAT